MQANDQQILRLVSSFHLGVHPQGLLRIPEIRGIPGQNRVSPVLIESLPQGFGRVPASWQPEATNTKTDAGLVSLGP